METNRQEIEEDLENRFLNKYVRYRAITDVNFVGKIDKIAYFNEEVIFQMNNDRFVCDLDWLMENLVLL